MPVNSPQPCSSVLNRKWPLNVELPKRTVQFGIPMVIQTVNKSIFKIDDVLNQIQQVKFKLQKKSEGTTIPLNVVTISSQTGLQNSNFLMQAW